MPSPLRIDDLSVTAKQFWLVNDDGYYMVNDGYISYIVMIWLVVFQPTPLKNDGVKVSWDYYSILVLYI